MPAIQGQNKTSKTILIIDDDEHIREILRDFLQSHGYNILLAKDGLQGMSILENEKLDLAILDIKLPFVSGIGLVEIAGQSKPDLPIICITGYGYTPKSIAEEKTCHVFNKPFELKEILETIQKLLN